MDVDGLLAKVDEVADDAHQARCRFGVTTAWKGRARTESRVEDMLVGDERIERSYSFATDEPSGFGGDDETVNPQELLLGAMNACMVFGYVAGAALRGVTLEKLEIRSTADLDLRGFLGLDPEIDPGYDTIRCVVTIRGDGTPEQYQEIHETVRATSPNYLSALRPVKLESELTVE